VAELKVFGDSVELGRSGMRFIWAVAEAPAERELLTGDRHLVKVTEHGVLVAVLDALGHGADASQVADVALECLKRQKTAGLEEVLLAWHEQLRGSRGVVAGLAWFDHFGEVSWLAVGNVSTTLWRSWYGKMRVHASARVHAGIIGAQVPRLHAEIKPLQPNDLLILATDGIGADVIAGFAASDSSEAVARKFVAEGKVPSDDGLVLVGRYESRRDG
jgi:negative regulator of sigma-B (phosphoserine phosphatase)